MCQYCNMSIARWLRWLQDEALNSGCILLALRNEIKKQDLYLP